MVRRGLCGTDSAQKARRAVVAAQTQPPHFREGGEGLNIQDITTLITTVGFPIAACIALFWQNLKMSEMISNNTEAILELTTIIKERLPDGNN